MNNNQLNFIIIMSQIDVYIDFISGSGNEFSVTTVRSYGTRLPGWRGAHQLSEILSIRNSCDMTPEDKAEAIHASEETIKRNKEQADRWVQSA